MQEGEPHCLIAQLAETAVFQSVTNIHTVDGLRAEYADGFGLMRASNTTPVVVLRFEADSKPTLSRIQTQFREIVRQAAPTVDIPF